MARSRPGDASAATRSPIQGSKIKPPGTPCYLSHSKIPLPSFLEESPVGIGRPRNELRNRDLTGVENSEVEVCKPASVCTQGSELNLVYTKPGPHAFLRPGRMREAGAVAGLAALTPISVNALGLINSHDGGAIAGRTVQTLPASTVKHLLVNLPSQSQSASTPEKLVDVEIHRRVEDEETSEVQTMRRTVVWCNAVFCTENFCYEQSPGADSSSSTQCSPSIPTSAALDIPCVSGDLPNDVLRSAVESSGCYPSPPDAANISSPKELNGILESSNMVTITISPDMGTGGASAEDSFISTTNVNFHLNADSGSTKDSVIHCDVNGAEGRTASKRLELVGTTTLCTPVHTTQAATQAAGAISIQKSAGKRLYQEQSTNLTPIQKNPFDASTLRDEVYGDSNPAVIQPTSLISTDVKNTPSPQNHQAHDIYSLPSLSADVEDIAGLREACILNNSQEQSNESRLQVALPPDSLIQVTEAIVEAELEDDIQREIEHEISEEILHLSQKLANLQARHGAQRMMNGSLPAVLSCPVTPVLTPRDTKEREKDFVHNQGGAGESGIRHRRGRVAAAKSLQRRCQEEANLRPEFDCSGKKPQEDKPYMGSGDQPTRSLQQARRKESLGLKLSYPSRAETSDINLAANKSAHSSDNGQETPQEEWIFNGEDSLEGTPSSGSLRSNVTDSVVKEPSTRALRLGGLCPQEYPDNNRRFDWVKTLRSRETGVRSSPETGVFSRQPRKLPRRRKPFDGVAEPVPRNPSEGAIGNGTNDLADITDELESRLNELAIRTTMAGAQSPVMPALQGSRSGGRVVASRFANSEPGVDKHSKGSNSKIPSEDYGCLDRRTAIHLMKAGLTRGPAGKKLFKSPYSKSKVVKSCSPQKDGDNQLRRKSMGTLHGKSGIGDALPQEQTQIDEPKERRETWLRAPGTSETEYETFVEDGATRLSELFNAAKGLHEVAPVNGISGGVMQTSPALSVQDKFSLSEASDMRLRSKRQPARRSYIRCIELVVEKGDKPVARRPTKSVSRSTCSEQGSTSCATGEKVEYHVQDATCEPPRAPLDAHHHGTNITLTSPHVTSHPCQDSATSLETAGQESLKKRNEPLRTVCRLFGKDLRVESHANNMSPGMGGQDPPVAGHVTMKDAVTPHKEQQLVSPAATKPVVTLDLLRSAVFGEVASPYQGDLQRMQDFQDQEALEEPDTELTLAVSSLGGGHHKTEDESVEAEKPVMSSVRAMWKELIDALEKERLRLPKIRTETGTSVLTSPRDSGRVKRIAEREKVMEYFNLEDVSPDTLQGRGCDLLVSHQTVAPELITSTEEIEVQYAKKETVGSPNDRQVQLTRKETQQQQDVRERHGIQQRPNETKKSCENLSKNKTTISGNEIEGLDLESFWCLVGEFEDPPKNSHASSTMASWTSLRSTRRPVCEDGA